MDFQDRYGPFDRLLYRVAFRADVAQRAMADLEEALFEDTIRSVRLRPPVFISALPRSGTTILLKILVETGHFASHIYRDMPFLLCPLLWQRFSRRFAVDDVERERAHGDGLQVSANSPEAFEEMIWKHFWPEHYDSDRVHPWTNPERNAEFEAFFENHMRKIVALRRQSPEDCPRYLSKNNLNISRLGSPPAVLRGEQFLVPFRDPLQQAASMLRQHRRFSDLHERDDFVREYMGAIGHHEFGKELKPVDFSGWLEDAPSPHRLEFWVRYWVATYRYLLEHQDDGMVLVSYARLTEEPETALVRLAEIVGLPESDLVPLAGRLHPPRNHDLGSTAVPSSLVQEAESLLGKLTEHAAV